MTGIHLSVDLVDLAVDAAFTPPRVEAVLRDHQIRRPALSLAATALLGDWTARLRAVFEAEEGDRRHAVINGLLADGTTGVYLTTHDGLGPHLHFTPDEDSVVGRVRAVTAGALAIFALEAGGHRLGVCAREGCPYVFADTSRGGRRAYCSARCGNHDAVRRHRARRAGSGAGSSGRLG